jgi:hypothetical protein
MPGKRNHFCVGRDEMTGGFGRGFGQAGRSWASFRASGTLLALWVVCLAAPAAADWRIYTSADLGYSVAEGKADGVINFDPPTFNLGGKDTDVSPLLGAAFGLAVPMDEIAPLELPRGWRLPSWDMRLEVEAVGLRNYKFKTSPVAPGSGPIITEVDSWSVMTNLWMDLPLRGLYRPISWTTSRLFGRWRLRTLKYVLDRTTLNMGGGVGVANLDVTTNEADSRGTADEYNFAWQVGVGFGYQITDRVNLGLGYRYIDPGTAKYRLKGGSLPADGGSFFKIDPEIHEARGSVRIEVWDFATPWR